MSVRIFGSGGGVITDATAIPEDVISGQIFYNNDGRQVGCNPSKRIYMMSAICYAGSHEMLSYTGRYVTATGSNGVITGYDSKYNLYPMIGFGNSASDYSYQTFYTPIWSLEINKGISEIDKIIFGNNTYQLKLSTTSTVNILTGLSISGYRRSDTGENATKDESNPRALGVCFMLKDAILLRMLLCINHNASDVGNGGGYIDDTFNVTCYYTD